MSYQVLARKWRPRTFDELVGQQHVLRALSNGLDGDRLHHAYLFTGTRGVGKTTIARILAKCLNCEQGVGARPCGTCAACQEIDAGRFVDLIEVDAASRAKVDETRELMDNVQFLPTRGRFKVYLIDEVHMFSTHSFNALLKTLEEPPPHVKFLLATTDPQKLPVTVLSRCLQFSLKRLPAADIAGHLAHILSTEGVVAEPEALRALARAADGSMRDALSVLDQAIAFGDGELRAAEVHQMLGTLDTGHVRAVLDALAGGDAAAVLDTVERMASAVSDYDEALAGLLAELQRIAVLQAVPDRAGEEEDGAGLAELASRLVPEDVQLYYQIGLMGRRDLPQAPDQRSGFEMVLLRMLAFRPAGHVQPPAGRQEAVTAAPVPRRAATMPAAATAPSDAAAEPPREQAGPEISAHEPAVEASPGETGTAASLDVENWSAVVAGLELGGMARQLAANCVYQGRDGSTIRLTLAPAHGQLAGPKVREKLEQALAAYSGERVSVRIDLREPEDETPAVQERRMAEERQQAAVKSIEADPNVRAVCDAFGARVETRGIRPVDS